MTLAQPVRFVDAAGQHDMAVLPCLRLDAVRIGAVEADLDADAAHLDAGGRQLFFNLNLSLDPSSTPPGKYLADFTVRDQNSDKTAKFSIDFEIAG